MAQWVKLLLATLTCHLSAGSSSPTAFLFLPSLPVPSLFSFVPFLPPSFSFIPLFPFRLGKNYREDQRWNDPSASSFPK